MAAPTTTITKTGEESGNFFSRLPWYFQMGILLILVLVLIFACDLMVFSDTRAQTEKTAQEVERLRIKNQQGNIIRANLQAAEETLKEKNEEMARLRDLLPDALEISKVFSQIEALMVREKLVLGSFEQGKIATADYYTAQPMKYQVSGSYDSLGQFFSALGFFTRIVSVGDVEIRRAGDDQQKRGRSIEGRFTVTAYFISPGNLKNLTSKKPVAPAKPAGK